MTNVYLYGELRNKFGEEFNFNINSAKEAFSAINANRKEFLDEIKKLAIKGIHYRIVVDDQIVENIKELEIQKAPKEMHLVPIIWGAGKNAGTVLMTAAAIAVAIYAPEIVGFLGGNGGVFAAGTTGAKVATAVQMVAAAVAVQGAMSLLYPQAKPDFNQEVQAGGKSYLFGGKENNVAQGQAVPVGYGRLLVGSSQISENTSHYSLKADMRALMTPTDQPIDDYMQLDFIDENQTPGSLKYDSFYTNQSSSFDDSPTFYSINVLNSYINILTKTAETVTSSPVEVVIKTNGNVISNPNLSTYNEDISFTWTDLNPEVNKDRIKIENPYAFDDGLVYRVYKNSDFSIYSQYNVTSSNSSYFENYNSGQIVRYGPVQFEKLNFQTWDTGINYISGDLVWYDTGDAKKTYFQSISTGSGNSPTGTNNTSYWVKVTSPEYESMYKCLANNTKGFLPTDTSKWSVIQAPLSESEMNLLTTGLGNAIKEDIYNDKMDTVSPYTIDGSDSLVENSLMEFLGYFYVPKVADREIDAVNIVNGTKYEITKIGTTNWSSIGADGVVAVGTTFIANSTTPTGNGKVYPVVQYKFTLDCDDAADLYIDGQKVTSAYGTRGMSFPKTNSEIEALDATVSSVTARLTTGYHRLYARLYNGVGASGLSLYYKYDSNWDNVYSDWKIIDASMIKHQKLNDLGIGKDTKFLTKILNSKLTPTQLVAGRKYRIITNGTIDWHSIGAHSGSNLATGGVFVKNSTSPGGDLGGVTFSDTYSYAEAKSVASNRLMRFFSQRPADLQDVNSESAIFSATYQCRADIGRTTIYSSPIKIYIKFLPTSTNFKGTPTRTILPITAQQTA